METCPIHGKKDYSTQSYSRVQRTQKGDGEQIFRQTRSVEKTRQTNREGVIREKRNYILFERVIGTEKEREKQVEEKKTANLKAQPKPKPKPKVEEEKPVLVKKTEVIDNYDYKESVENKKIDPRRKSITIHQRLCEPVIRETFEAQYPNKSQRKEKTEKKEKPEKKTESEVLRAKQRKTETIDDDDSDNYRYLENKNITKPHKRQSEVIHKRRSGKGDFQEEERREFRTFHAEKTTTRKPQTENYCPIHGKISQ